MIVCLHGFLGTPADWDFLRDAGIGVMAPDLFAGDSIPDRGDTLLGYSMGGRLALEALLAGARYDRAVIISAGLNLESGREERRVRDREWARRFECDPWDELMTAWNVQSIFGGSVLQRRESDFDRAALARALREWSPAILKPLRPRLGAIMIPVLWMAGEHDNQYVAEAELAVSELPNGRIWICPDASHRIPWEKSDDFIARLREFVE